MACGCSEGNNHGFITAEREREENVMLVMMGGVCANLGVSTSWQVSRLIRNDLNTVKVKHVIRDML